MKLSVVIVNYNVRHFLEQALHSVQKACKGLEAEVWVVDNNSVDNSVEMVKANFPTVKVIANKVNTGFSKANNQAIRESSGEYVLLLNPDTVLQEDTLTKCVDFMDAHPDCGGLGVRMIDGKGKFLPESKRGLPTPAVALFKMTGLSTIFPKSKLFGKYHLKYLGENETNEVDVLSGAFMMLRKETLDKVGLLDEAFFMYGEDIDLSYRIQKGGYKNYYFPGTTIIHYKGESTKKKSANYVKVFYNAMVLFARKHYSQKMAGWFAFFIMMAIQVRAFIALLWRFVGAVFLPMVDFATIYLGFFGIAKYWEQYNKFVRNFYPTDYYWIHIPAYIFLILIAIFLSGGYDRPFELRRLVRGSLFGSLVLFAVYAFLPKEWQFSRAILGLGCAWALLGPVVVRLFKQLITQRNLRIIGEQDRRIAIVAKPDEAGRIRNLLAESMVHHTFLGMVSPSEDKPNNYIGTWQQLDEVVEIFDVNLVIFSAADVSGSAIMSTMSKFAGDALQFKIVPENSWVIIGSGSKNSPGELFSIDVKFAIAEKYTHRRKRILDIGFSFISILFFPLLIPFKNGRRLLANLPAVLWGSKTLVSYTGSEANANLPKLAKGVFAPIEAYKDKSFEPSINLAYARDYHPQKDIILLGRIIFR